MDSTEDQLDELSDSDLHLENKFHGRKLFELSSDDQDEINYRIQRLRAEILSERSDFKATRSLGIWQLNERIIKMIHCKGSLIGTIGFQNVQGKFLKPFEALYLLETDRLDIYEDEALLTVYKAYQLFLPTTEDLIKYKAFRAVTFDADIERQSTIESTLESCLGKRKKLKKFHEESDKITDDSSDNNKDINGSCKSSDNASTKTFKDIFDELKAFGAQEKLPISKELEKSGKEELIFVTKDEINAKLLQGSKCLLYLTKGESSLVGIEHGQTENPE